jgi:hypothetical protein
MAAAAAVHGAHTMDAQHFKYSLCSTAAAHIIKFNKAEHPI